MPAQPRALKESNARCTAMPNLWRTLLPEQRSGSGRMQIMEELQLDDKLFEEVRAPACAVQLCPP